MTLKEPSLEELLEEMPPSTTLYKRADGTYSVRTYEKRIIGYSGGQGPAVFGKTPTLALLALREKLSTK